MLLIMRRFIIGEIAFYFRNTLSAETSEPVYSHSQKGKHRVVKGALYGMARCEMVHGLSEMAESAIYFNPPDFSPEERQSG